MTPTSGNMSTLGAFQSKQWSSGENFINNFDTSTVINTWRVTTQQENKTGAQIYS